MYTIYLITNLVNNKYYIGKHITNNLTDNYMGSGKYIKRAVQKYGIENFVKETVCICETEQQMNQIETLIINQDIVNDPNSYNLNLGGISPPHLKGEHHPRGMLGRRHSKQTRQKMSIKRLTSESTRNEAKKLRLKTYLGQLCPKCNNGVRYTSNASCKACYMRRYYASTD